MQSVSRARSKKGVGLLAPGTKSGLLKGELAGQAERRLHAGCALSLRGGRRVAGGSAVGQ